MGYYIDFVFGDHANSYDLVYEKFCQIGLIEDEEDTDRYHDIFLNDLDLPITLWKRLPKKTEINNWAQIRFSWAVSPQNLKEALYYLLDLSMKLDCSLYDGQIKEYITAEYIDKVCKSLENGASLIKGMIGTFKGVKKSV
jgi:hypothetical protein